MGYVIPRCCLKLVVVFSFLLAGSAVAFDSQEGAKNFVEKVSSDALAVITSGDSEEEKKEKLTKLFVGSVDTKWIARFAMGKYWREATEQQRNHYVEVHRKFLLNSYIPKFKQYNNQEIKILRSYVDINNPNEHIVETQIVPKDGPTINVDYKIRESDGGKYMIYDVIAEGVSLISTERSDFGSVLGRSGIDELIRMLGERV